MADLITHLFFLPFLLPAINGFFPPQSLTFPASYGLCPWGTILFSSLRWFHQTHPMLHNFHRSLFQQFCFLNNVFFISFNSNTLLTCQLWQPTPRTPLFSSAFELLNIFTLHPEIFTFFPYSAQNTKFFLFYISVPLKQNTLFFSIPTIDPTLPLPLTMKTNALIDLVHLVQWGGTPCCGPTWKTPYENLARHSWAPARRCGNTAPHLFAIPCDLPRLLVPVPGHVSFPRGKKKIRSCWWISVLPGWMNSIAYFYSSYFFFLPRVRLINHG